MDKELQIGALLKGARELLNNSRLNLHRSVNQVMVLTYWELGKLIVEDEQSGSKRAEYGKRILDNLSAQLTIDFGKGFNVANLRRMRSFYLVFPIRSSLRIELSWTHYRSIIRVKDPNAREWYMQESARENWSARALERQIGTLNYERLLSSKDKHAVRAETKNKTEKLAVAPRNSLRDPYFLEFLNLPKQTLLESNLEQALIDNLQSFILELGAGFAFVERQQRISTEDQDFYIDLVFYNFKLKRFLLIDLKIEKLNHQDVGQMDTYVRMYDQLKIQPDDNETIGLILCSEKSEAVAKYSVLADSEQLFASKYLPSVEQLQKELQRERKSVIAALEQSKE